MEWFFGVRPEDPQTRMPVRFLVVTPRELARAANRARAGRQQVADEAACEAFLRVLKEHPQPFDAALRDPTPPSLVSWLILTCYAATGLELAIEDDEGAFSARLRHLTGDASAHTGGLGDAWCRLQRWLHHHRLGDDGDARYRELVLAPEADLSYRHIGQTLHLAFPRANDMESLIDVLRGDVASPTCDGALGAIQRHRGRFSRAFRDRIDNFAELVHSTATTQQQFLQNPVWGALCDARVEANKRAASRRLGLVVEWSEPRLEITLVATSRDDFEWNGFKLRKDALFEPFGGWTHFEEEPLDANAVTRIRALVDPEPWTRQFASAVRCGLVPLRLIREEPPTWLFDPETNGPDDWLCDPSVHLDRASDRFRDETLGWRVVRAAGKHTTARLGDTSCTLASLELLHGARAPGGSYLARGAILPLVHAGGCDRVRVAGGRDLLRHSESVWRFPADIDTQPAAGERNDFRIALEGLTDETVVAAVSVPCVRNAPAGLLRQPGADQFFAARSGLHPAHARLGHDVSVIGEEHPAACWYDGAPPDLESGTARFASYTIVGGFADHPARGFPLAILPGHDRYVFRHHPELSVDSPSPPVSRVSTSTLRTKWKRLMGAAGKALPDEWRPHIKRALGHPCANLPESPDGASAPSRSEPRAPVSPTPTAELECLLEALFTQSVGRAAPLDERWLFEAFQRVLARDAPSVWQAMRTWCELCLIDPVLNLRAPVRAYFPCRPRVVWWREDGFVWGSVIGLLTSVRLESIRRALAPNATVYQLAPADGLGPPRLWCRTDRPAIFDELVQDRFGLAPVLRLAPLEQVHLDVRQTVRGGAPGGTTRPPEPRTTDRWYSWERGAFCDVIRTPGERISLLWRKNTKNPHEFFLFDEARVVGLTRVREHAVLAGRLERGDTPFRASSATTIRGNFHDTVLPLGTARWLALAGRTPPSMLQGPTGRQYAAPSAHVATLIVSRL